MYDFPIKYYEDNLIFNKKTKDCWAVYKIPGFNYDFLSADRKIMRLNAISRFIANIGAEAKILIIPTAQDIKTHYKNLTSSLNPNDALFEYAKAHAKGSEAYLTEKLNQDGASNDYSAFVMVKMQNKKTIKKIVDDLIKRPFHAINELMEVEFKEILLSELRSFEEMANAYFAQQSRRLPLEKVTPETVQWLIRRMMRRGISAPVKIRTSRDGEKAWTPEAESVLKDGEKALRPHERDVLTLTEGIIEPSHKRIKVTNSDGNESYQVFLAMASIPDGIVFPGGEWLLLLQDYPVATEVCIHITTIEHRESVKKISGKKREIDSQMEHVAENDKVPDELYEAQHSADELEAELKQARDPLTLVSVSMCIASDNEEIALQDAKFIRERYEDMNFIIEHPMADQFKLFMEFIPGAGRYVTDYILKLPPRTVAGSMFPASRLLGDNLGAYIGSTGVLDKLVFLDMARACRLNRSASAAFLGTLGGGKSFNANLLLYLNVLMGGRALIIDPKGERSGWLESLPELSDHISVITLTAGETDRGKLDPYLIYRGDIDAANELAINILCELFKINPKDEEYTALLVAARQLRDEEFPCMSRIAEILASFPESDDLKAKAKNLGRKIDLLREAGMGTLLFGNGNEKGLSFHKRLNIVQIQNLSMPDPSTPKEDYTQEQTLSTVLMIPIASFAKQFASSDRHIFKVVLFDESWALNTTQIGIKLFNELARLGRSLNASTIFIGHAVTDLKGDGIKAAITYKFCFKATVKEEIERVLEFLDLEKTEENMRLVASLPNGQCLFQDLDGRVGVLKFDAVYEHLEKAFDTRPPAEEV